MKTINNILIIFFNLSIKINKQEEFNQKDYTFIKYILNY